MAQSPGSTIIDHLATRTDPRVERTKGRHLLDILTLARCATISGADEWAAMAACGEPSGSGSTPSAPCPTVSPPMIPSGPGALWAGFAARDPDRFHARFPAWIQSTIALTEGGGSRWTARLPAAPMIGARAERPLIWSVRGRARMASCSGSARPGRKATRSPRCRPYSTAALGGVDRDDRCDGLPDGDCADDHRPGSGLCARPQGGSGDAPPPGRPSLRGCGLAVATEPPITPVRVAIARTRRPAAKEHTA